MLAPLSCSGDPAAPAVVRENFLRFESDAGDWVGQGESRSYEADDGVWQAVAYRPTHFRHLDVYAQDTGLTWAFSLTLASPPGEALRVGDYDGATTDGVAGPRLSFGWASNGCSQITGRFVVHDLDVTTDSLRYLRVSFEQHCEGKEPGLRGELSVVGVALER